MSSNDARLNAVIAALEKVSDHINTLSEDVEVDCAAYNRWIAMLEGVVDGNWKSMMLDDQLVTSQEMLMHVEAAIAFLEELRGP